LLKFVKTAACTRKYNTCKNISDTCQEFATTAVKFCKIRDLVKIHYNTLCMHNSTTNVDQEMPSLLSRNNATVLFLLYLPYLILILFITKNLANSKNKKTKYS